MVKFNGTTKWLSLGIIVMSMIVTFFVRAALVEERLDVMDASHVAAREAMQDAHDKDIGYIREDVSEIKKDVKEILKKL